MMKYILLVFIAIFSSTNIYAAASKCDDSMPMPVATYQTFLDSYKADYTRLKQASENWQGIANTLFTLTLLVTVFGAIVSALQSLPDSAWKKWLVASLGVLIASTTYFKDTLPDGSYKTFQQARERSKVLEGEIERGFLLANTQGLNTEDLRVYISYVCERVKALQELSSVHSAEMPQIFDFFINSAKASPAIPDWVNSAPKSGWIVAIGEGASISEAKRNAEYDGNLKIEKFIQSLIDQSSSKPIYRAIRDKLKNSLVKMIGENDVYFDTSSTNIRYWILYRSDERAINGILSGISFPLTIFSTDLISKNLKDMSAKLSELGFVVSVAPAPRGDESETNTLFVGEGVPVSAIQETVRILVGQNIPIKAIVYPWQFQKSQLPDIQKINHLQIGGSSIFESWPKLESTDIEKLMSISSSAELILFCKSATAQLKAAWGL